MSATTQRELWSRRDKRTAYRAGHVALSKPSYRGEDYNQRSSFGAFRPYDYWYDGLTPYEFVETVRGRRAPPPGPRYAPRESAKDCG